MKFASRYIILCLTNSLLPIIFVAVVIIQSDGFTQLAAGYKEPQVPNTTLFIIFISTFAISLSLNFVLLVPRSRRISVTEIESIFYELEKTIGGELITVDSRLFVLDKIKDSVLRFERKIDKDKFRPLKERMERIWESLNVTPKESIEHIKEIRENLTRVIETANNENDLSEEENHIYVRRSRS